MIKNIQLGLVLPVALMTVGCSDLEPLKLDFLNSTDKGIYIKANYDIEKILKQENLKAPKHGLHFYCANNQDDLKVYTNVIQFDLSRQLARNDAIVYFAQPENPISQRDKITWGSKLYCRYHLADLGYFNFLSNTIIIDSNRLYYPHENNP